MFACLLCHGIAQAQEDKRDLLAVTGQVTALASASVGGGGGIEWLHRLSAESGFTLGAFAFSLADSEWAYGKVSGFVTFWERTTVSAQVSLGGGHRPNEDFAYQIYEVEATQALIDKRLYVAAGNQYSEIAAARENVVKAGLILYPVALLRTRLDYHVSTGGNVDSRFLSGRVDLSTKPVAFLAGFLVGQTTPERFDVITTTSRTLRSEEYYAGVSIPVGPHEVSVIFDVVRQERPGVDKFTTLLAWKIPF